MKIPRICAVIVDNDLDAIKRVEPLVELFEVRIDLVGSGWPKVVKHLKKPWIACNRSAKEGGSWRGDEGQRVEELLRAIELGAAIIDIELATSNLTEMVSLIRKKAECLISCHDLKGTPPLDKMRDLVKQQLETGADLCKVVTTAKKFEDNLSVLQLLSDSPSIRLISFAMGPLGLTSRILCPLVGSNFTYASIEEGRESASGQITVTNLANIYRKICYVN